MSLFDLSGILSLQRKFLLDISNSDGGGSNANINNAMSSLQSNLNDIHTDLSNSESTVNYALTKHGDVLSILSQENQRLTAKKGQVDNYHQTVIRSSDLNDNIRKKQSSFIKVFLVIIGLTIVYIGLIQVNKTMPFPSYLLETIMVIVFSFGGIYLYLVLRDIYTRSNMDFDKLYLPPPNSSISPDKIEIAKQKAKEQGNLLGTIFGNLDYVNLGLANKTVYAEGINRYVPVCSAGYIFDISTGQCIFDASCSDSATKYQNVDRTKCGPSGTGKTQVCILKSDTTTCVKASFETIGSAKDDYTHIQPYTPSEMNEYSYLSSNKQPYTVYLQ
jgi:uncharacterized membrane protein (DUF485 family)